MFIEFVFFKLKMLNIPKQHNYHYIYVIKVYFHSIQFNHQKIIL